MGMKKRSFNAVVMMALILSFTFGIFANTKVCSAKVIDQDFSVTAESLKKVAIKNDNKNNAVTVTFTAYPDNISAVARVKIFKTSGCTGTGILTATFNKTQKHDSTFRLPAGATYYALISPASDGRVTGTFHAEY